jgi:hypothetical protein
MRRTDTATTVRELEGDLVVVSVVAAADGVAAVTLRDHDGV